MAWSVHHDAVAPPAAPRMFLPLNNNNNKSQNRLFRLTPGTLRQLQRHLAFVLLLLIVLQLGIHEVLIQQACYNPSLCALTASNSPLPVEGAVVTRHDVEAYKAFKKSRVITTLRTEVKQLFDTDNGVRVGTFDNANADLALPRKWSLVSNDKYLSPDEVDANTCVVGGTLGAVVTCLPALIIIGFEKCSTSTLDVWLSYHPNIALSWQENRFFGDVNTTEQFEARWRDTYLQRLPNIPGGPKNVGKYWTAEKSPAYVMLPQAPELIAKLMPNTRLLAAVRNPTRRAYSHFLMYTCHYVGVSDALRGQPVSFFIRNMATGDVQFTQNYGPVGQRVPRYLAPATNQDQWKYLSFPPAPQDFDTWIRSEIARKPEQKIHEFADRDHRILFGGCYSSYLKEWAKHFPQEHIVVVPTELFFTADAPESMNQLQKSLGLPLFNYSTILRQDEKKRYYLDSIGSKLIAHFDNYGEVPPMLESTKRLLDEFYCESNKELSRMLGGRALPGYSCVADQ